MNDQRTSRARRGAEPEGGAFAADIIVFAYLITAAGHRSVGRFSVIMATIRMGGITLFCAAARWAGGISSEAAGNGQPTQVTGFVAAAALPILASRGFTTFTNSGSEIADPLIVPVSVGLMAAALAFEWSFLRPGGGDRTAHQSHSHE